MRLPLAIWREIHAAMPILCVDVLVFRMSKCLLLQRAIKPMKDEWYIPGGRLFKREALDAAARRIVREETALEIRDPWFVDYSQHFFDEDPFGHGRGTHTVSLIFAADSPEGKVRLDGNHFACRWVSAKDLPHGLSGVAYKALAIWEDAS